MPYETELQRHLDIFALSLSLKKIIDGLRKMIK